MKLRIRGNTLRLRLTRGEVDQLATDGVCEETMHLARAWLSYRLVTDTGSDTVEAQLADNTVTVVLPATRVADWAKSDGISIEARHGPLSILVEKDFACLTPRAGEDDADAFPHPETTAS